MISSSAPHSREPSSEATARRNLLLSFPELEIAHDGRDVVDSLVEGVVVHLLSTRGAQSMIILNDVSTTLKSMMGLTYEPSELVASFERLSGRDRLSFRDDTHRSFVYSESVYQNSIEALRVRTASWDAVGVAWVDQIRQRYGINEAQGLELWQALDAFATKLIDAYGAEAAAFLYLHDANARGRFLDALDERLPEISESVPEELAEIAKAEFPNFFDPSNPSRTDYLVARLRASFFFHLLSVDPTASNLVRVQVSEKTFYLDSNFLFRLIGFHGPLLAFSPLTTVEISRLLNCRLLVAQETINEFLRVLKANVGRIKSTPIHRAGYLRIAGEHPSDEGEFMAAYYREFHSGRVKSVEEFGRKWSNIHPFLEEWEITIDEDALATEEEKNEEHFLDEVSRLQKWQEKNPAAVDHDVFMMRLIRNKRGKVDATLSKVRYWFLTYDRQLTRYAAKYATDEMLPVALLADDWLQVARPFLPRTEDYAKSFVAMLRYPILYQGSSNVPFAHMAEALSRLERYEELPTKVVAAMVADSQFVRNFIEAKSEDAARTLVETRAGRVAGEAISRGEILEDKVEQMQHQIATLTENIDTLHSARDTAAAERDRARKEAAEATGQVASMQRDFPVTLEARLRDTRRWAAYWSITAIVTILGLGGLILNWDHLNPIRRILVLIALGIVWLGLLWIPKGTSWAITIVGSVASVVALGLAVYITWLQFPVQDSKLPTSQAAHSKSPSARLDTVHGGYLPTSNPAKRK